MRSKNGSAVWAAGIGALLGFSAVAGAATVSFNFVGSGLTPTGTAGTNDRYQSGITFQSSTSGSTLKTTVLGYVNTGNASSVNYVYNNTAVTWTGTNGLGVYGGPGSGTTRHTTIDAEHNRAEGLDFAFTNASNSASVTLKSLTLGLANVGEGFKIRITSAGTDYSGLFTVSSVSSGASTLTLSGDVASKLVSGFKLEAVYDASLTTSFRVSGLTVDYAVQTVTTPTTNAAVPLPAPVFGGLALMLGGYMARRLKA